MQSIDHEILTDVASHPRSGRDEIRRGVEPTGQRDSKLPVKRTTLNKLLSKRVLQQRLCALAHWCIGAILNGVNRLNGRS